MAYLHQNRYFEVNPQDIKKILSDEESHIFIQWIRDNANVIRFPWGDKGFSIEQWAKNPEQQNLDCPVEYQKIIFQLKNLISEKNTELIFKP